MVLLITASKNATQFIAASDHDLGEQVELAASLQQGAVKLKAAEFSAIVVDQSLLDVNPDASDALWQYAGTAIPVFANFAISGADRVIRDLRAALIRRQKEQVLAARAAQAALRNELTGAVAGILLSSELALAQPGLPATITDKLRSVYDLAVQLKTRLENVA